MRKSAGFVKLHALLRCHCLYNAVNNCFSGIRVSDSEPLSVSDLMLCRKTDLLPDENENSISVKRECLKPGTKVKFSMEIDESLLISTAKSS